MKVFTTELAALTSMEKKATYFLNSKCPYNNENLLCGNWCALFYLDRGSENQSACVILGCKAGEKLLFVESIEGDYNE